MKVAACLLLWIAATAAADELPMVLVAKGKPGFVLKGKNQTFAPWGFNYDRDDKGRLIEDYWEAEWDKVVTDFGAMKKLGANVVRIHLQFGRFMEEAAKPNQKALARLKKLIALAEETGLYLDLTGLGCYHKADVPAWYDGLGEVGRWDAQGVFWRAVAEVGAKSPAIFCYNLMNEPVVPGGKRQAKEWLGPAFAGKHYTQMITLDQQDRPRAEIARQWIKHLTKAIRSVDSEHLITVGLVDWSLDRPGLTSGFIPEKIVEELDFLAVHLYPKRGKIDEAINTLKGFALGKPVLIEETFPLHTSTKELAEFIQQSERHAAGVLGFYWGKNLDDLRRSKQIPDAMMLEWLEWFAQKQKERKP